MERARHLEFFRQQLEFPYFSRYSLANIFQVTEEQVLDRYLAERWKGVNWSEVAHSRGGFRDERLYSAYSMPYETRVELASGLTSCLEEHFGPLLVAVSWDAARYCDLVAGSEAEALRAALYRASQFQYARVAAHELRLTDYDAIAAVAAGFAINPAILHAIHVPFDCEMLDWGYPNTLLDMDVHLSFLALARLFQGRPASVLFPEFPMESVTVH